MPVPIVLKSRQSPRTSSGPVLMVSEVFGPTFQGEGPSLGQRCSFLRLGGCNLHCTWCDTPYTWDWTGRNGRKYDPRVELKPMSIGGIWSDLVQRGADMLVISGGEPLLQQARLVPLLELAQAAGWWVEIETAGTIAPLRSVVDLVSAFNVSPKLNNSGNEQSDRYRPLALEALQDTGKVNWKFVVRAIDNLTEVDELVVRHSLKPVYIMPEGITPEQLISHSRAIAEQVLARGWRLTTRLHVFLYGNQRGV